MAWSSSSSSSSCLSIYDHLMLLKRDEYDKGSSASICCSSSFYKQKKKERKKEIQHSTNSSQTNPMKSEIDIFDDEQLKSWWQPILMKLKIANYYYSETLLRDGRTDDSIQIIISCQTSKQENRRWGNSDTQAVDGPESWSQIFHKIYFFYYCYCLINLQFRCLDAKLSSETTRLNEWMNGWTDRWMEDI